MPPKKKSAMDKSSVICSGFGSKQGQCNNVAPFPKIIPYCINCAGASFEEQVAKLFKVQGYKVFNNLSLSGTQHDIFAVLDYGFVSTGVLVECKWKFKTDAKVDSEAVRKFASSWTLFKKSQLYGVAHQAFLVTNGSFAPEAIEVAKNLDIALFSYQDLIGKLIKFDSYLDLLVKQYLDSPLNGHYISLTTSRGSQLTREVIRQLKTTNAVVLLGDYGSGKTSFCLKLCHDLANGIKNGQRLPLPIYIQLKDYSTAINMDSLITNLLVNNCRIPNANIHTFRELLECVQVILIFDGFDEIARRVDYTVKYKVFNQICQYAKENTKIVVTCRPNFFNHKDEFERIFKASPLHFEPTACTVDFNEIEVGELNTEQIRKYIFSFKEQLNSAGLNCEEFFRIIDNVHDLWDLAKRPVLLYVIVQTIPKIREENANKINAASLYNTYTRFWLDREDSKGKTLIKASQKMTFTRQLAKKMFINNNLSMKHEDLPLEVKRYFEVTDSADIEHFSHDIRSCSFLNIDERGDYKFIHKSFMEYFVAQEIVTEIKDIRNATREIKTERLNQLLGVCLINLEIGLFIRDLVEIGTLNELDIKSLRLEELSDLEPITRKNLISVCCKVNNNANELIKGIKDLEGVDFSYAHLAGISFENINFDGAIFFNSVLTKVILSNCSLVNTVFRKAKFSQVDLYESNCETSDFSNSTFKDCSFEGTVLAYANINNSRLENCDFFGTELTDIKYNDETEIKLCKNIRDTIGTPYGEIWELA